MAFGGSGCRIDVWDAAWIWTEEEGVSGPRRGVEQAAGDGDGSDEADAPVERAIEAGR